MEAKKLITKKSRLDKFYDINGWSFIGIAVVLLMIFNIYPVISSFFTSFQVGKGVMTEFGGLTNIKRLFKDVFFKKALVNTFVFFIFQVPIMLTLALIFASMLNDAKLRFKGFFRTAIFLPCVTSLVAYSILFKSIFAQTGVLNNFLINIGIASAPIPWFTDPFWAKALVIIAITWRWTGYNMIFYLAGLQNIDPSLYEAARIDGASRINQFFNITVPMLKPIILFTSIMSTIGTLQLFDEVQNLMSGGVTSTSSGPGNATLTLSQYIYRVMFNNVPEFGYAATIAYVIVFIVALLAALQIILAGDKNEES